MTTRAGYAGTTTNLQIVLNTQKNPYLKLATQKNTCQIFLPQKIPESKIPNPKKSFDHPRHLKSGVPPWVYISHLSSGFRRTFRLERKREDPGDKGEGNAENGTKTKKPSDVMFNDPLQVQEPMFSRWRCVIILARRK